MMYFHIYVAVALLLTLGLAINVSLVRIRERIANGDGGNRLLRKAIRAHMNAFENVIPYGFIVLSLSQLEVATPLLASLTIGFILARFGHAFGVLKSILIVRQVSAASSYALILVGCVTILISIL